MASAMFAFAFTFAFTFTFTFVFPFPIPFKFVIVLVDVGRNQCFIVKRSHSENLLVPGTQWMRMRRRRRRIIIIVRRVIRIITAWRIVITFRVGMLVVVRKFKFLILWWERMVQ